MSTQSVQKLIINKRELAAGVLAAINAGEINLADLKGDITLGVNYQNAVKDLEVAMKSFKGIMEKYMTQINTNADGKGLEKILGNTSEQTNKLGKAFENIVKKSENLNSLTKGVESLSNQTNQLFSSLGEISTKLQEIGNVKIKNNQFNTAGAKDYANELKNVENKLNSLYKDKFDKISSSPEKSLSKAKDAYEELISMQSKYDKALLNGQDGSKYARNIKLSKMDYLESMQKYYYKSDYKPAGEQEIDAFQGQKFNFDKKFLEISLEIENENKEIALAIEQRRKLLAQMKQNDESAVKTNVYKTKVASPSQIPVVKSATKGELASSAALATDALIQEGAAAVTASNNIHNLSAATDRIIEANSQISSSAKTTSEVILEEGTSINQTTQEASKLEQALGKMFSANKSNNIKVNGSIDPAFKTDIEKLLSGSLNENMTVGSVKVNSDKNNVVQSASLIAYNDNLKKAVNLTLQLDQETQQLNVAKISTTNKEDLDRLKEELRLKREIEKNTEVNKNNSLTNQANSLKTILSLKTKMVGLDTNSNQYQELNRQLNEEKNRYSDLSKESKQYFSTYVEQQTRKIKLNQAAVDGVNQLHVAESKLFDITNRQSQSEAAKNNNLQQAIAQAKSSLVNLSSPEGKNALYSQAYQQSSKSLDEYTNKLRTGEITVKQYNTAINNLLSSLQNSKWSTQGTIGQATDLQTAQQKMRDYAREMSNGNVTLQSFVRNGEQLNYSVKDQTGAVRKLSLTWDSNTGSIRQYVTSQTNAATATQVMGASVKNLAGYFTRYMSGYMMVTRVLSAFTNGINTLKEYDNALTTISYTMDLTQTGLNSLGQSAIDMANDMSMAIDDAMSITQIYANMATTADEIMTSAKPTVMLSNASGVGASTAADQIQSVLMQFDLAEEQSEHIVDVYEQISANLKLDYAKGIETMAAAVKAAGQMAYEAGLSFEQLAAITGKVAEKTREDGSSIGNSIKTIATRISRVGKLYPDEVSNEDLSNASKSLHDIGVEVYNTDGSFRELDVIISELQKKWDGLNDAQQSNISYNVAATRQTNKFKAILDSWTESMSLAEEATTSQGTAQETQEKYLESFSGKMQAISTQWDTFWIKLYNNDGIKFILDVIHDILEGLNSLSDAITPLGALLTTTFAGIAGVSIFKSGGRFKMQNLNKYAPVTLTVRFTSHY